MTPAPILLTLLLYMGAISTKASAAPRLNPANDTADKGATSLPRAKEHLFREVSVTAEKWEVVFHSSGVRFAVKVNGVRQGISEYSQRLVLKRGDVLELIEKHSSCSVEAAESDGKTGIKRTRASRDFRTGQRTTETVFEPSHQ
jgi:hypothetical protein